MTPLSLLSTGWNRLGHGRGLSRLWLGRSARLICIIHPTGWITDGLHESNMLNSYNWLNNRFDNELYRQPVVSCKRGTTVTHFVVSLAVTMLSTAPNALRDGRIACQLLVRGRYFVLKIVLCLQLWQRFLRLTQHHFCGVWYATCHNSWKTNIDLSAGHAVNHLSVYNCY